MAWSAKNVHPFLLLPLLGIGLHATLMAQDSKSTATESQAAGSDDPYVWLEDVTGEKAIDWVKARNAKSQAVMEADPRFNELREDLLAILDSDARIPFVSKQGDFYYNFWRDKKNERGLWRRTTLDQYKQKDPKWEVILDLDALGEILEKRAQPVNVLSATCFP